MVADQSCLTEDLTVVFDEEATQLILDLTAYRVAGSSPDQVQTVLMVLLTDSWALTRPVTLPTILIVIPFMLRLLDQVISSLFDFKELTFDSICVHLVL